MKFMYVWKNRLSKFIDYPPAIIPFLKKRLYYNFVADSYIKHYKDVKFLNYDETIEEILNKNKSIVRFGDDVFDLLLGIGLYFDNWRQVYDPILADRLKEVLSARNENLLVCFNPEFILKTKEDFVREGIGEQHHFWTNSKIFLKDYIHTDQVYGSALSFQPHFNKNLPIDRLVKHLKTKHLVIVSGDVTRFNNQQLGLTTVYIEGPSSNAWVNYEQILDQVKNTVKDLPKSDTLILTALGPTSRVMILDLVKEDYVVWEMGRFFDLALDQIKEKHE